MISRSVAAVGALALAALQLASMQSAAAVTRPDATRSQGSVTQMSRHPLGLRPDWRRLVQAPRGDSVRPVKVVRASGQVSNPEALAGGRGVTTLRYSGSGPAPVIVLDYGQEIGGISWYDVASSSRSPVLQSGFSETLRFLTPTGDGGGGANAIFHSGAADRYEKIPIRRRGRVSGPLVQGGQRYQYLTLTAPGTVELSAAGLRITHFLSTPDKLTGHFLSSDHELNRIWYAGVHTLNLNQIPAGTAQLPGQVNDLNLIIDGAKRDRAPWTGDQLVAAPTAFHSVPLKYVRDTLTLLGSRPGTTVGPLVPAQGEASQPGPMPAVCEPHSQDAVCYMYTDTYSMMYVLAVRNYLLYSGDTAFARQAWPLVTRQMARNQRYVGSDGLYSVEPPGDMNWNLETKPGVQTYVNGVYRETLLAAADIAEAIGEKNRVTRWRQAADQIKTEVNRRFFNKATGVYDPNADERGAVLQDANVQAVLSGIATGDQAERVLARLADTLDTAVGRRSVSDPAPPGYIVRYSPFMGSLNLQAEFEQGDPQRALRFMRDFWGHMVDSDPGGVFWERPDDHGALTTNDSAAHAWSTGPTAYLSKYVLGVAPTTNGFTTWSVRPQPADLQWAQGEVPTPHGPITVAWQRHTGRHDRFVMTVTAPEGTRGTISVPRLGSRRVIAKDGRVVWNGHKPTTGAPAQQQGDYVTFRVDSGRHTFAWTR